MHSPLSGVYVKNDHQLSTDESFAFGYFEPFSPHVSLYCNGSFCYEQPYTGHNSSNNHNKMEQFHTYSPYYEPQPSISSSYQSEQYTARFSECFATDQCFIQSEVIDSVTNVEFEIPESPESLSSSSYNYRNTESNMRGDEDDCDFSGSVKTVEQCDQNCDEICLNYFVNNGSNGTWNTTIEDQKELGTAGEHTYG